MTMTYPLNLILTATELIKQATIGPDCAIAAPDGLIESDTDFDSLLENIEECSVNIDAALSDFPIGSHEWAILTNLHTTLNLLEADMIP